MLCSGSSEAAAQRTENQEKLARAKASYEDLEAIIQTKDVEKKHLENDKMCVEQEKHQLRLAVDEHRTSYSTFN